MGSSSAPPRTIGRYQLFDEIASGGMATVHIGRMTGHAGFARTVAIKRLHPQFAKAPEFVAMLIDEARLAARIRHPNVVSTLDIVTDDDETLLVMDYVQGVTLAQLQRLTRASIPPAIAVSVMTGALYGLHAAHEARSEEGVPLGLVHRDVSPQNILVGADGVTRVVDFGVAKAAGRLQTTRDGQIKGKTAYMAPEQIRGVEVDRRTDVYAASVVLWELLAGRRLFTGDSPAGVMNAVLEQDIPLVSALRPEVADGVAIIVARGLSRDPGGRWATAREMAVALESAVAPAPPREVGDWVETVAASTLDTRARSVARMEASSSGADARPGPGVADGSRAAVTDIPVTHREPQTSTTTSSLVSERGAPRPRRARVVLAIGVALAAIAGTAQGVRLLGRDHGSVPAAFTASAPPVSPPDPSMVVPAAPSTSASSAAPSSPPRATALASDAQAPARQAPRPPPAPRAPALDCNPPYTIDAKGARHWKNGC